MDFLRRLILSLVSWSKLKTAYVQQTPQLEMRTVDHKKSRLKVLAVFAPSTCQTYVTKFVEVTHSEWLSDRNNGSRNGN